MNLIISTNRNCESMADRFFISEMISARGVKKNHHEDHWLMEEATRSSGPNFRQSAGSWGHRNHSFSQGKGPSTKFSEAVFLLLRSSVVSNKHEKHTSQKLRFRLLRTWGLLLRTCLLPLSPPPLVLCSLPPSNFFLGPPLRDLLSETCQSSGVFLSCHEITSSRTIVGRFRYPS